jgi:SAM-dependent methyltransferase
MLINSTEPNDMNNCACPLCGNKKTIITDSIPSELIAKEYYRVFSISLNLDDETIYLLRCENCDLKFFNPMVTGDCDFYEKLQTVDWYYMTDKPEYQLAKKYLPAEGLVLEIGSGKAAFAVTAGISRYIGIEFNDAAIKKAKERGVKLIKESVEVHAKKNVEKYGVVVSFQVLEHVSNPNSFIQSCVDSLTLGGKLIIAVPNNDGICGLAQNNILDMPPHHLTHWTGKTLTKLAPLFGLELLDIEYEQVAEYHRDWAQKTVWETRLRRLLRMSPRLLDLSLPARVASKMAVLLAKTFPVCVNGLTGHTVVAAYRKVE